MNSTYLILLCKFQMSKIGRGLKSRFEPQDFDKCTTEIFCKKIHGVNILLNCFFKAYISMIMMEV